MSKVLFTDNEENIDDITDHGSILITVHEDSITAITFHGENLKQMTDHENTPASPPPCGLPPWQTPVSALSSTEACDVCSPGVATDTYPHRNVPRGCVSVSAADRYGPGVHICQPR